MRRCDRRSDPQLVGLASELKLKISWSKRGLEDGKASMVAHGIEWFEA
jgi:hypothetical protein